MFKIAGETILESEVMYIHCPQCKSAATIPIVYGKPTPETVEAGKYGLIHMGGCVIDDERINRHCKACNCDFVSDDYDIFDTPLNQVIPIHEMNRMLDNLESELKAIHQDIEREFMRIGRETLEIGNFEIINILRMHHEVRALFLEQVQGRGDPTKVIDHDGKIIARYSNDAARIYMTKMNSEVYWSLTDLAKACHRLGRASRHDNTDIDELKNASIAVQNARQQITQNWQNFRVTTTTYCE